MSSPCCVCVCESPAPNIPWHRLSKHNPAARNTHEKIEELLAVYGTCHVKYEICCERKVGNFFIPEFLVCNANA
jgi:hypothetical protein